LVSAALPVSTTKTYDVYADISSSAVGNTVIPTMTVTYRGAVSNVTATTSSVVGPTISATLAVIASNDITFVPATSPVAQFLVGGTSLVIGKFNFRSLSGVAGATIKDIQVIVPADTVGSVTLNGVTASVVGTVATLYNVGIVLPADASGIDANLTASLVCVGAVNGCAGVSSSTVTATIATTTYNNGSSVVTVVPTAATAVTPSSVLVASKPTVVLAASSGSGLANGNIKIGEFTIAADAAGDIKLEQIPVVVSSSTGVAITAGTLELRDYTGSVALSNVNSLNGSGVFTFSVPRTIAKSTTETYTVYTTLTGVSGPASTVTESFSLGAKSSFKWTDVSGGQAGITGTAINSYPTGTQTKSN
jgi:hypothetical protein